MAAPVTIEDPSIDGARHGDPVAWADLYERFHPIVRRYLEVVAPDVDPESVWEVAAHSLVEEVPTVAPLIWVLRSAQHLVEGRPDPDPGAAAEASVAVVRRLPRSQMEVVTLRVVGGLSDAEVAAVLGSSSARVAAAAHAALQELVHRVDAG